MSKKRTSKRLGSFGKLALLALPLSLISIYLAADQQGWIPTQKSSYANSSLGITAWATKVEWVKLGTNRQGGVYAIPAARAKPTFATGVSNFEPTENVTNTFYSLGYGGDVVYSFGKVVNNVPGFDITIHEATVGNRATYPEEKARIEVSQDWSTWKVVGTASSRSNEGGEGIKKIDIASTGWSWIGYIRIIDTSDRNVGNSWDDGFDLDAIGVVKLGTLATPSPNSLGAGAAGAFTNTSCSMGSKTANQLNLVAYNMGDDGKIWKSTSEEKINRLSQLLVGQRKAEIIALQEIIHFNRQGTPETSFIKKYFPGYHVYTQPHNPGNEYSNMILSRYPISNPKTYTITATADGKNNATPRVNLSVLVDTPKGKIRIFNIHPRSGSATAPIGVKKSLEWVKQVSATEPNIPIIVLGDFNQSDINNISAMKSAGLNLISPKFPGIDHIYLSALSIKESCRIGNGGISGGHDPVFVTTN